MHASLIGFDPVPGEEMDDDMEWAECPHGKDDCDDCGECFDDDEAGEEDDECDEA